VGSRGGIQGSDPKRQNGPAASRNPPGAPMLVSVAKETIEGGCRRVLGPVGVLVSALDTIVEEGEVLIGGLTRNNDTVLDNKRRQ
jgi:hypothetical protein